MIPSPPLADSSVEIPPEPFTSPQMCLVAISVAGSVGHSVRDPQSPEDFGERRTRMHQDRSPAKMLKLMVASSQQHTFGKQGHDTQLPSQKCGSPLFFAFDDRSIHDPGHHKQSPGWSADNVWAYGHPDSLAFYLCAQPGMLKRRS